MTRMVREVVMIKMQNVRYAEKLCQVSEHMLELHLNCGPLLDILIAKR